MPSPRSFRRLMRRAQHRCVRRLATMLAGVTFGCPSITVSAEEPARAVSNSALPAELQQGLRSFAQLGSVLYIAAHPDDENTQLITYLARGRGLRTGYLSLTRGDGGQNEIGPQFGEKLGLARTFELIAAREQDGGRQFFSRAIDFGFSKSVDETLKFWNRKAVLGDVVRVIRTFRPDVIVTRFSPIPGGTHGHHTASAILAVEAFKLAGDPSAYPEQLDTLKPWSPVRVVHNHWARGGSSPDDLLTLEIGGTDPITGEGLGTIAARSRAQHVTQGFANYNAGAGSQARQDNFLHLAGTPARNDLLDDVNQSWTRYPGGDAVAQAITALERAKADPDVFVPALLQLRNAVASLAPDPVIEEKRALLDTLLTTALGLEVRTTAKSATAVPGNEVALQHEVKLGKTMPVKWTGVTAPGVKTPKALQVELSPGETKATTDVVTIPVDQALTHPYWLREPGTDGLSTVPDPRLIGLPSNPPDLPIRYHFELRGHEWSVATEVVAANTKTKRAVKWEPVKIVAPVAVSFPSEMQVFAPASTRPVHVTVDAMSGNTAGEVQLAVPSGWSVQPASRPFKLSNAGERVRLTFDVTAPGRGGTAVFGAEATIHGRRWNTGHYEIDYPHLPVLTLQPRAQVQAVALAVETRGSRVGYVPGAGDNVADAIRELGYSVDVLSGADLVAERLRGLDAIVFGVRAFNERADLQSSLPAVWQFIADGGTAIVQYNRPNGLKATTLGPYELSISGEAPKQRVTHEDAPVTFLAPNHPVLVSPNKISADDFAGWVQERGLYFPSKWDESKYVPVLSMSDPGEEPLKGALLVANHGRGHFVYTSLAFFRQLPAGNPGAIRLFANLLSLSADER